MSSLHSATPLSALRLEAEARLEQGTSGESAGQSTQSLLHELQVHQIELEMQNEQLMHIRDALEESRDRYFDLYDSAPVAYLTLDVAGQITDVNLRAASLLGESHAELRESGFARFVAAENQGRWGEAFESAVRHGERRECVLEVQRKDGSVFSAHLDYACFARRRGVAELRICLTDITSEKSVERVRCALETRLSQLTRRQREVLALAISGMANKAIALRLGINQRTVENHRAHIHKKTGADSLLELVQQATRAGVVLDLPAAP